MKKGNCRYEVVFRTVYLDEDFEETGVETGVILFQKESDRVVCVDKNIEYSESHANGNTEFELTLNIPKAYEDGDEE
jgi:hypothetical protein